MNGRLPVLRATNLRRGVQLLFLIAFLGLILWGPFAHGPRAQPVA